VLYLTTRDRTNVHTPRHPICKSRAGDGGFFAPFRPVSFCREDIAQLKYKTFGQCIADILNLFFSTKLSAWDVDFCIGRNPARLVPMSHKIIVVEAWNNPQWDFRQMVKNLRNLILEADAMEDAPTDWMMIAVRIAVLFGVFSELGKLEIAGVNRPVDVAVSSRDFSEAYAVWYARKIGLPIGNIIFGCEGNPAAWDLIRHGELTKQAAKAEPFPWDLERLIHATFGQEEALRFVSAVQENRMYTLTEQQLESIRPGFFGAVISPRRTPSVIRNVYSTRSYLLSPDSAVAYGALQDYRATSGESAPAVILTEQGPSCAQEAVAQALGISVQELSNYL